MRTIYKYNILDKDIIEGPITKIISAQAQCGKIAIWAEVDTTKPNRKFQIIPIGTGWNLDAPEGHQCILDTAQFIDTIQLLGGTLVFHVYAKEIIENKKTENIKKIEPSNASFTLTVKNAKINMDALNKLIK